MDSKNKNSRVNNDKDDKRRWMRAASALCMLALAVGLYACFVPSLMPLYTEADLVEAPEIVGTWRNAREPDTWQFARLAAKDAERINTTNGPHYLLTYGQARNRAQFVASLVRFNGKLLMDIFPLTQKVFNEKQKNNNVRNPLLQSNLYPVHTFARLDIVGDSMSILAFNPSDLDSLAQAAALPAVEGTNGPLVTASTAQLQAFVKQHLNNPDVFKSTAKLARKK
jgi:hypothetical protein